LCVEHRPFGRRQRNGHDDEQWDDRETRQQTPQNQDAADHLEGSDEWSEQLGHRQANFQEAASPELIRKQEFLQAF
jgi:23S rRNA G2445 N2-methylase RlmL